MPQCKAKAKSTGKRCVRAAVAGYTVCRVHGANHKNPGGRPPTKHNLYGPRAGEKIRKAMAEADKLDGIAAELSLARGTLATYVEQLQSNTGTTAFITDETLAAINQTINTIAKLAKTAAELQAIKSALQGTLPAGMQVVIAEMGTIIRENIPKHKWKDIIDRLSRTIDAATD